MILKATQSRMMVQSFVNERSEQLEVHAQKLGVHAHNFLSQFGSRATL